MEIANQAALVDAPLRPSSFWPEKLLGRRPGLKEANVLCWALFVAFLLVPMCAVAGIQLVRGTGFIRQMQPDFIYLYGDGQIVSQYSTAKVYDYNLQMQTFNAIHHPKNGIYGPSPYPPFIPLFFSLFSHLPFEAAYGIWLAISLALYLTGVLVISKDIFPKEPLKVSLIVCFALAYYPFMFSTLVNGQLASLGVCAVGLGIFEERQGNSFRSGLALGFLLYKITLVPLIILMLIVTRRGRTLLGFIASGGTLLLATNFIAGWRVWPAYVKMLSFFGRAAAVRGAAHTQLWTHLDLDSCFVAIAGSKSTTGMLLVGGIGAVALGAFIFLLWESRSFGTTMRELVWAATLILTLLLNIYIPVYDSTLAVIAVILTLGALRDLKWDAATEWITLLSAVLLFTSWVTEPLAKIHKLQLLTIGLVILGVAQLWLLSRAIRGAKAEAAAPAAGVSA